MSDQFSADAWLARADAHVKSKEPDIEKMLSSILELADPILAMRVDWLANDIRWAIRGAFIDGVAQGVTFAANENHKTLEQAE